MRILRVRRGFTTNSSSAAEYVPGQTPTPSTHAPTPPPAPARDLKVGETITILPVSATNNPPTEAPPAGASVEVGNAIILISVAALVGGAIGLERFFKHRRHP